MKDKSLYVWVWVYVCVCVSGRYRFTLHLARQQWFAVEQYKYDARKWPSELTGGQPPYLPRSHYSDDKRPTGHFSLCHWQNECSHISSLIFGATNCPQCPLSSSSSWGFVLLIRLDAQKALLWITKERSGARKFRVGLKTRRRLHQTVVKVNFSARIRLPSARKSAQMWRREYLSKRAYKQSPDRPPL